jgi:ubiquinone/menaquinone biosynthesis C-methylase UbiE
LYNVPNFVQGSLLDLPLADDRFGIVVVAEVLEHCPVAAAGKIFTEVHRVLRDEGVFVLTFPWDTRPPEVQHAKHLLMTWDGGITSWHQTVWLPELFDKLVADGKFKELTEHREILDYGHCQGVGTVLAKA